MQSIPSPPRPEISLRLPEILERWLDLHAQGFGQKLLVFAGFALFLYLVTRLGRRLVDEQIADVNRRHVIRKAIGYGAASVLLLFATALFADMLGGFGTVLGLVLAGIAVALQDVLKSVVGWFYLSTRAGVEIGSRIEVAGVTGDVIDIGVLKTTVAEVGNLVFGEQSTGRIVTIPNYQMLSANVQMSGEINPFVWQEVRVTVPFDSDWRRAEAIMREVGEELHAEVAAAIEEGFRRLERRYAFKYGAVTPIVYVTLGSYGTQLTLRFLTHVRRRRGSEDLVSRRILEAFAADPAVRFAYPTYRGVGRAGGGGPIEMGGAPDE